MYGLDPEPLSTLSPRFASENAKLDDEDENSLFGGCVEPLELQYQLAAECMGLLYHGADVHWRPDIKRVLLNAFHTSLFNFWTAPDLTRQGFYGPAPPVMRLSYEGQLIAKFCSVHASTELYQRWETGDPYIFGRGVLRGCSSLFLPPQAQRKPGRT